MNPLKLSTYWILSTLKTKKTSQLSTVLKSKPKSQWLKRFAKQDQISDTDQEVEYLAYKCSQDNIDPAQNSSEEEEGQQRIQTVQSPQRSAERRSAFAPYKRRQANLFSPEESSSAEPISLVLKDSPRHFQPLQQVPPAQTGISVQVVQPTQYKVAQQPTQYHHQPTQQQDQTGFHLSLNVQAENKSAQGQQNVVYLSQPVVNQPYLVMEQATGTGQVVMLGQQPPGYAEQQSNQNQLIYMAHQTPPLQNHHQYLMQQPVNPKGLLNQFASTSQYVVHHQQQQLPWAQQQLPSARQDMLASQPQHLSYGHDQLPLAQSDIGQGLVNLSQPQLSQQDQFYSQQQLLQNPHGTGFPVDLSQQQPAQQEWSQKQAQRSKHVRSGANVVTQPRGPLINAERTSDQTDPPPREFKAPPNGDPFYYSNRILANSPPVTNEASVDVAQEREAYIEAKRAKNDLGEGPSSRVRPPVPAPADDPVHLAYYHNGHKYRCQCDNYGPPERPDRSTSPPIYLTGLTNRPDVRMNMWESHRNNYFAP